MPNAIYLCSPSVLVVLVVTRDCRTTGIGRTSHVVLVSPSA